MELAQAPAQATQAAPEPAPASEPVVPESPAASSNGAPGDKPITITMSAHSISNILALAIAGAEAAVKELPGSAYRERANIAMASASAIDELKSKLAPPEPQGQ